MTVFALPRQQTTPFTVVGLSTVMLASAASSKGRPSLATHPAFARLPLFRSDCEQERRLCPLTPPVGVPTSKNSHAAKTPWEPDLAVTTRSNHHSCLDRSAHPTFSILQGFSVAHLGERPWQLGIYRRYQHIHGSVNIRPQCRIRQSHQRPRKSCSARNKVFAGRVSKRHVIPLTFNGTILSFIGGKPSPCCSSSFHVPDVTAKRGFCLQDADVKLELSTEALWFLPLWGFLLCVLERG